MSEITVRSKDGPMPVMRPAQPDKSGKKTTRAQATRVAGQPGGAVQSVPAARTAPRAHILVVDDDVEMCTYLTDLLGIHWSIETALDAYAALEACRSRVPDLLLTDVMMTGMDGFALLHALRADPATEAVPVIVISARAGEQPTIDALQSGADDYLVKPFSPAELTARVRARLEIARLRREANARAREAEDARRRAERRREVAESLREVLAILNSDRSSKEVLTYIAGQAVHLLGSQAALIYRLPVDASGVPLEAEYGSRFGTALETFVPISRAHLQRTLVERGAISISDTSRFHIRRQSGGADFEPYMSELPGSFVVPIEDRFSGVAAAPIMVRGELFGGLALFFTRPRRLSADERGLVSMLSDQVALAVENAKLRDQVRHVSATEERDRLARELHDAVTQLLFSASLIANSLPRIWEVDPDAGRRGLDELRILMRGAIAEMRTLLIELRPTGLTAKPFGELLRQLGEAVVARSRLQVTVDIGPDAIKLLPPEVQIALYRIAQEATTNIVKHARAQHVYLQLIRRGDPYILRIRDDGRGFSAPAAMPTPVQEVSPERAQDGQHWEGEADETTTAEEGTVTGTGHLGFTIMRERASSIGASYVVKSRPGHGTLLVVRWPGHEGR